MHATLPPPAPTSAYQIQSPFRCDGNYLILGLGVFWLPPLMSNASCRERPMAEQTSTRTDCCQRTGFTRHHCAVLIKSSFPQFPKTSASHAELLSDTRQWTAFLSELGSRTGSLIRRFSTRPTGGSRNGPGPAPHGHGDGQLRRPGPCQDRPLRWVRSRTAGPVCLRRCLVLQCTSLSCLYPVISFL